MMINHIITSSLVIIFVLLMGTIFENKISACLKYSLWLLVVIKLLLPFPGFESQFHVLNFIESYAEVISNRLEKATENNLLYEDSVTVDKNINNETNHTVIHDLEDDFYAEAKENQEQNIIIEDNNENKVYSRIILSLMVKIVYFTGVMICFAAILISNLRFYKAFKSKREYISTYNDKIHVYKLEDSYGACLYGGFSPVIIVGNNTNLSMEQQNMILLHEYVHYAHGDHIWSMIRNLCVALYWYHPLVWLAASVSKKDSELACDEGTIRRLGKSKRTTYGRMLLEVVSKASRKKDITSAVFLNSTTATRGKKEMRKRITMIAKKGKTNKLVLILTIMLSIACIGCTFGEPIEEGAGTDSSASIQKIEKNDSQDIAVTDEDWAPETVLEADEITQKYSNVYVKPQKDKVCILIQPSELREQLDYYYIPENEVQEELKILLNSMEVLSGVDPKKPNLKLDFSCNWSLEYDDKHYQVFESGYSIGTGTIFYDKNPELIDKVNHLLLKELNYGSKDIDTINNLTSATLSIKSFRTDYRLCEQTITDEDKLKDLEVWFCNAKRVSGAYDCGNNEAVLLLKTASGQEIKISLATDDCPIFAIDGVYYDYRPADKVTEGWYSNHVFDMFDQIPNAFEEEDEEITSYVWPTVSTTISTTFGERVHPITGEKKMIEYIGIAGKIGDLVCAVADGDIIDVGFDNTLGSYIVLATVTGEEVTYGHLSGIKAASGAKVKAGDIVGLMDKTGKATGPFLSISVKVNGETVDPMLYFETDFLEETIIYNGKEYKKSELSNNTLQWLELSELERGYSSYFPPEFMIFDETWGITLSAENITPTGLTIVCTQSGGEPTGELQTGGYYFLEKWNKDNGWKEAPCFVEITWEDIAWAIPMEDTVEWEVNWGGRYGTLPVGKYRIGKIITDFRQSGDFDNATYYAEFEINNEKNKNSLEQEK